jgi:hypothetical protein
MSSVRRLGRSREVPRERDCQRTRNSHAKPTPGRQRCRCAKASFELGDPGRPQPDATTELVLRLTGRPTCRSEFGSERQGDPRRLPITLQELVRSPAARHGADPRSARLPAAYFHPANEPSPAPRPEINTDAASSSTSTPPTKEET